MSRKLKRLSAVGVGKLKEPGYYGDGAGLWLQIAQAGTKSWIFRFTLAGRSREMGLGSINAVGLADARDKAQKCRSLLAERIDPIEARNARNAQDALARARTLSFRDCAERYVDAHKAEWRNPKHQAQWRNTLTTYAYPIIGDLPVADVDTALVSKVLQPLWTTKHETATRLRQRVEAVLDWAKVLGYRTGDNPARWDGHLEQALPHIKKANRVRHHPALPYGDVAAFMQTVRGQAGTAARCLEFVILTAARTGEAIAAKPEEFDLAKAVWTVPAERTKAHRVHRVPLSPRAVEIVREQIKQDHPYVFPGLRDKQPLSNMGMLALLRRMGRAAITVHGFRSTFKDWCAEATNFPNIVSEAALAHTVSDKVESAYRRGDLFDKRRALMDAWAKHCEQRAPAKVVAIRGKQG